MPAKPSEQTTQGGQLERRLVRNIPNRLRAGFYTRYRAFLRADVSPDIGSRTEQTELRGAPEAIAFAFFENAVAYSEVGETQRALAFSSHAARICHDLGNRKGEAVALFHAGTIYYGLGNLPQALEFFNVAGSIFEDREVDNKEGQALTFLYIGTIYYDLDDLPQALAFCERALRIFEEIGEQVGEREGEARTFDIGAAAYLHNTIGLVYTKMDKPQRAVESYKRALLLYKEVDDWKNTAFVFFQSGIVYYRLGNVSEALELSGWALSIFEAHDVGNEEGNEEGKANALHLMGLACFQLGETQRALESLNKAWPLFAKIDEREQVFLVLEEIKRIEALDAESLDKSPPAELLSPDDTTTQQGRDAVPDVKPVIEKAKEELTTYTPRERGRRGYGAKTRVGTTHVSAHLPKDLAIALNEKVRKEGTTIQELFERFAIEYVGETLPRETREKLLEREIAHRRAELGLT